MREYQYKKIEELWHKSMDKWTDNDKYELICAAKEMMKRYISGSHSGGRWYVCDTHEKRALAVDCVLESDARRIADALNAAEAK